MKQSTRRGKRANRKAVGGAPVINVGATNNEITPLATRRFLRFYEIADKRRKVSVSLEEGARYCGGAGDRCEWCKAHDQYNHAVPAPTRTHLMIEVKGTDGDDDASLCGFVTAAQIDAIIDLLIAVREKARVDGALVNGRGLKGD